MAWALAAIALSTACGGSTSSDEAGAPRADNPAATPGAEAGEPGDAGASDSGVLEGDPERTNDGDASAMCSPPVASDIFPFALVTGDGNDGLRLWRLDDNDGDGSAASTGEVSEIPGLPAGLVRGAAVTDDERIVVLVDDVLYIARDHAMAAQREICPNGCTSNPVLTSQGRLYWAYGDGTSTLGGVRSLGVDELVDGEPREEYYFSSCFTMSTPFDLATDGSGTFFFGRADRLQVATGGCPDDDITPEGAEGLGSFFGTAVLVWEPGRGLHALHGGLYEDWFLLADRDGSGLIDSVNEVDLVQQGGSCVGAISAGIHVGVGAPAWIDRCGYALVHGHTVLEVGRHFDNYERSFYKALAGRTPERSCPCAETCADLFDCVYDRCMERLLETSPAATGSTCVVEASDIREQCETGAG